MSRLRDYLKKRQSELEASAKPLETRLLALRADLASTEAKLSPIRKELHEIEKALQAIGKERDTERTVTIKEAILQTLANAPNGLTSSELLAAMNDDFFEGTLQRTSMSPQLARLLHKDKKITNRGEKYFLP